MFVCVMGGGWWLMGWWLVDVVVAARAAHGGREMGRNVREKREEERGRERKTSLAIASLVYLDENNPSKLG